MSSSSPRGVSPRGVAYLGWLLILGGVVFSYLFGVHGIGRSGVQNFDGTVFFAAGKAWLAGYNPYDHADLERAVSGLGVDVSGVQFFYPPPSSLLCIPLGLFDYSGARIAWLLINGVCLAVMAFMAFHLVRDESTSSTSDPVSWSTAIGPWLLAAIVLGNPFGAHVLWMGQSSIVASVALLGAWYLHLRGRAVPAGLALGIATFKPQLCLLLILWWMLERQWKTLAAAAGAALVASLGAMAFQGPVAAVKTWVTSVTTGYTGMVSNTPGFQHKVGLESMFHAGGVHLPGAVFTTLGVLLCAGAWMHRERFRKQDVFALLTLMAFVFVGYSHDYDYIALAPVWVTAWLLGRARPRLGILLLVLHLSLLFPQRLLRPLELPVLNHWRTIVLLILGVVLFAASRRSTVGHGVARTELA